ncbi:MAG: hypothetical protein QF664_10455 [Dehalococcoidia bacterium]|nr:hypothetical protein [Dehalococcoidia bacterium]
MITRPIATLTVLALMPFASCTASSTEQEPVPPAHGSAASGFTLSAAGESSAAPYDPVGACTQRGTIAANRSVIEFKKDPNEKHYLSDMVVAFRTICGAHDGRLGVLVYHLPTGYQLLLDPLGQEVSRLMTTEAGRDAIEAALRGDGLQRALEALVRPSDLTPE